MTEVFSSPPVRVVAVAKQGPAGPPGAVGPTVAGNGGVYIRYPEAQTIPVCPAAAFPFVVIGLRVAGGALTLSVRINGADVPGLAGLAVTAAPQSPVATGGNTVAVGDRVALVIDNVAGATDLEFTRY